jgi:hypothetical protein
MTVKGVCRREGTMEVTATGDAVDTADVVVGVVDFVGVEEGGVSGVGGKKWVATDNHHVELGRSGRHVWEEAFALLAIVKIERNLCTI